MGLTAHGRLRGVPGACAWALIVLAVGCGDQRSPSTTWPAPASEATHHIVGTVFDKPGHPLAGAVVTILDGPLVGTTSRTDDGGRFELKGYVAGRTTLRASRDGFQPQTQTVVWQPLALGAIVGVPFWLESVESLIGLEPGTYTLAVTFDLATARTWKERPDTSCAGFPVALAARSYRAEITWAPQPHFFTHSVTAEDPTLRWRDLFGFYVSGSYVGFRMEGGVGAGLYEEFPGFRYLEIGGETKPTEPAIRSGSSISIPFTGAMSYCRLKSARGLNEDCYQVPAEKILEHYVCVSDHIRLVFTPR
jgi:hypothetical protein